MAVKALTPVSKRRRPDADRSDKSIRSWSSIRRDINRLFEGFFTRPLMDPFSEEGFGRISPRMDVKETETEIIVEMEAPGMSEKDIGISISDGLLTLNGEKRQEPESRDGNYYCSERSFGRFERSIPLTAEIEPEKIEAGFTNGLLKLRLPKKTPRKTEAERIPIQIE